MSSKSFTEILNRDCVKRNSKALIIYEKNLMGKYFTIAFLLIFINIVLSQNTDSLRRLLYSKQNQEKADLLLTLSKAYWYTQRDTALMYASQALQFSRQISYAR